MKNIKYHDKQLKDNISSFCQQSKIKNCCFLCLNENLVLKYFIKTENNLISDILKIGVSAFNRLIKIITSESDIESQQTLLINYNRSLILKEESSFHYQILR